MKFIDLKLGEQYVTGDSIGYALVEIVKEAYNNPKNGPNWIEVQAKCVKTGKVAFLGYNTEYPAYAPYFESYNNWISRYPPEMREYMKESLS